MQKLISYLILLFVVPGLRLSAQPVLDASSLNRIGNQVQLQPCFTTNVQEGQAGAGQVWNFSTLSPKTDEKFSIFYVNPNQTPKANLFPSANLATKYTDADGSVSYAYFNQTGPDYWFLGAAFEENRETLSEPDLLARLPMTFGQTVTSRYRGRRDFGTFQSAIYGTKTMLYDAYGRLTLPGATYQNAVRIKTTETRTDSVVSFSNGYTINRSSNVMYAWFVPGIRNAALEIRYSTVTAITYIPGVPIQQTVQPTQKRVTYQINPTSGTRVPDEDRVALRVLSANPSVDGRWLVEATSPDQASLTLTLYSADGRPISTQHSPDGSFQVDLTEWPAGIYRMSAQTKRGATTATPLSIIKL
jgi:hypothetical protein